jgi:hypothetical protein
MGELMGCATGSILWFTMIDVRRLSGNTRRLFLERVKSKLGLTKADELLGTSSRGLLHNIHGIRFCQGYVKSKRIGPAKARFITDLRVIL